MDRRSFLTGAVAASGLAWNSRQVVADDNISLPTRPLGKTGVKVTVLALGGYTGMKEPRSDKFDPVEMADSAIDAGIRYFDTAPSYGNGQSERNYGEVLAHPDRIAVPAHTPVASVAWCRSAAPNPGSASVARVSPGIPASRRQERSRLLPVDRSFRRMSPKA